MFDLGKFICVRNVLVGNINIAIYLTVMHYQCKGI